MYSCVLTRILKNKTFPYVWPWLPELAIFDLKIGFLIKNCIYFTPGMYGKQPKIRFFHGFSKAGFGHASLLKKTVGLMLNTKDLTKNLAKKQRIRSEKSFLKMALSSFAL